MKYCVEKAEFQNSHRNNVTKRSFFFSSVQNLAIIVNINRHVTHGFYSKMKTKSLQSGILGPFYQKIRLQKSPNLLYEMEKSRHLLGKKKCRPNKNHASLKMSEDIFVCSTICYYIK